jgi:hypothetical protein
MYAAATYILPYFLKKTIIKGRKRKRETGKGCDEAHNVQSLYRIKKGLALIFK